MQFIPSIVENWGFLRDGVSGYTCVSWGMKEIILTGKNLLT